MIETSHTFETVEEAAAFMAGFRAAQVKGVSAVIDEEEPIAVNVDCIDVDAECGYLDCIVQMKNDILYGNVDCAGHAGCECARCGDEITEFDEGVSSPHGSMHAACAEEHESEHPDEW